YRLEVLVRIIGNLVEQVRVCDVGAKREEYGIAVGSSLERAAAFSRHLTVNQHPQASSFESAARHGFPLGAGLRKDAEKLEQDCGGCHAGDAAGVEGRRDLDEIGADEIEAPQIADQTLGFKCREAARLRRPRPWRIDWIERVDIEGEIGGAAADNLSRLHG